MKTLDHCLPALIETKTKLGYINCFQLGTLFDQFRHDNLENGQEILNIVNGSILLVKVKANFQISNVLPVVRQVLIATFPCFCRYFFVGCDNKLIISPEKRPV